MTEDGKWLLEAEIACLRQIRWDESSEPDLCAEPGDFRIFGATRASAGLDAIDQEIGQLESALRSAVVLHHPNHRVGVGSCVVLGAEDGGHCVLGIVGPLAADFRADLVSYASTIGRALMGLSVGQPVEIESRRAVWRGCVLEVEVLDVGMITRATESTRGCRCGLRSGSK